MSSRSGRRVRLGAGVLGVLLLVGGGLLAYRGYASTRGPEGAVRAYYDALVSGDAPRALAWGAQGAVPTGSHELLTSTVLAAQQRIAPIRDLQIGAAHHSGDRASVPVSYRLAFAAGDVPVRQSVAVVDHGGWRLAAVAVLVQMDVTSAAHLARVVGRAVPTDTVTLFPGALPISFGTPDLELDPTESHVEFGSPSSVEVVAQVSDAGRTAAQNDVASALRRCLAGADTAVCPLPGTRYVPGSLRGSAGAGSYQVSLTVSPDGQLEVTGTAPFTGSFRVLTFANRQRAGHGTVELNVHATVDLGSTLRVQWVTT